jgi:hypothetical protein
VRAAVEGARIEPAATAQPDDLLAALNGAEVAIAAGGAGVSLLPRDLRLKAKGLRVAVDLNAVPPEGIEGIKATDFAAERDGIIAYGAIGAGGFKMKIHKRAVAMLFEANDRILDAEQIYDLGVKIE